MTISNWPSSKLLRNSDDIFFQTRKFYKLSQVIISVGKVDGFRIPAGKNPFSPN